MGNHVINKGLTGTLEPLSLTPPLRYFIVGQV